MVEDLRCHLRLKMDPPSAGNRTQQTGNESSWRKGGSLLELPVPEGLHRKALTRVGSSCNLHASL